MMASTRKYNLADNDLELIDPNPDIHSLFVAFDKEFFNGMLGCVELKWSPRMTLCAGLCRYQGRNGQCSIHLSKPLLSLRPRRDLVETLLHEMIHAYLFVVDRDRERESHGPKFLSLMHQINRETGTNITVYHSFRDEVNHYKVHWWQCNGPCKSRPPFFGLVKRSMNRAPGPNDTWYSQHKQSCNGTFIKIKEPPKKEKVASSRKGRTKKTDTGKFKKISDVFPKMVKNNSEISASPAAKENIDILNDTATPQKVPPVGTTNGSVVSPQQQGHVYGIIPFSGQGHVIGSSQGNSKNPGTPFKRGSHPLLAKWEKNKPSNASKGATAAASSTSSASAYHKGDVPRQEVTNKRPAVEDVDLVSSSDEEEQEEKFCPACGIDFGCLTLTEHLQFCDVLNDWD